MSGLTNYLRHKLLSAVGNNQTLLGYPTVWVGLFVQAPSSDGDENGGVLDDVEWDAPRIPLLTVDAIVPAGDTTPRWTIGPGDFGGWKLTNINQLRWSETDTISIGSASLVAGGIFDAETGGNLLAWDELLSELYTEAGTVVLIPEGELRLRLHKEL